MGNQWSGILVSLGLVEARLERSKWSANSCPSVSIVIPTYNSERTIAECLESIAMQDYPKGRVEIVVADGGSTDRTLAIVRDHGVKNVVHNPLRTGEAGKSVGVGASKNEIILFQDSDNLLSGCDWLSLMVLPFRDSSIVGAEPTYYTYRAGDPLITRYCSLLGMNDPVCLYLGNYDRYSYVTKKWTELPIKTTNTEHYLLLELEAANVPTMGANGFLARASVMKRLRSGPYLFDVDVIFQLVEGGQNRFAKVHIGIIHLFANSTTMFARKTRRRAREYLLYERQGIRKYPWRLTGRKALKFVLCTMLLVPVMRDSIRGYRNKPEVAWLFHPLASWITLITYGLEYVASYAHRFVLLMKRF